MTGTTLQVSGPKKLIRELYKQAKREHTTGTPFAGVFDQAVRLKAEDGHHELVLRRFGYLPFNTAKAKLDDVLDEIAAEGGLEAERNEIQVEAGPTSIFWGGRSLFA